MIEIPEKIEKTMYVNIVATGYRSGHISIWDCDYKEDDAVRLFDFNLIVDIPKGIAHKDIMQKLVEGLTQQKKAIQLEYHIKLKNVQDKIDNLLALPASIEPAKDCEEDISF